VTALAELSAALGVTVTGVRRAKIRIDGRPQPDDNAWRLELPRFRFGLEDPAGLGDGRPWSRVVRTQGAAGQVVTERLAVLWGRDTGLTPLTKTDGRRAFRLLHELSRRKDQIMSDFNAGWSGSPRLPRSCGSPSPDSTRATSAASAPLPDLSLIAREIENVMAAIKIIQLGPAPEDLWRFHAIHADTDGDAIVYISRVMALAVVQDEHDLGSPVPQRVVPIDADAMTYDLGLYDRVKPPASSWSTEAVHAAGLAEALELAEKWWRRVFRVALDGHDIAPRIRRSTLNTWTMDAGECSLDCARCVMERSGSRDEMPGNLAGPPPVPWDDL
jgi:hypothetical protein